MEFRNQKIKIANKSKKYFFFIILDLFLLI